MNDLRADLMRKGFLIAEKQSIGKGQETEVEIVLLAVDTDNMRFEYKCHLSFDEYVEGDLYEDKLIEGASKIHELITARKIQNISSCDHKITMIGTTKACACCMGKFGDVINLNVMYN